ncbi:FBD-associated F-box protein [Panicum miliaceum]|uniref:FBD-associated F-box protein n=1 Tax=Panicum miliaceum TaxID=4540 RepID=A0A3L6SL59_PANMI|nr:FBD-associated F-box protein [Panicum miliaceum]
MEDRDLNFLLARSPVLQTLVVYSSQKYVNIRIISRSLRCVQLCMCIVHDVSVVDAQRLERLFLWEATSDEKVCTRVKFGHAPKLRFVGYLMPGVHVLEVGNTIIKAETRASPRTIVPSVKTLALMVHFGVRNEAKMIPCFLRCFPNIETLHIKSEETDQPAGKLNQKFWKETSGIECVQSHIKELVFHEYRGERSEVAFLKFILENAQVLREVVILFVKGILGQLKSSRKQAVGVLLITVIVKWINQYLDRASTQGNNCRNITSIPRPWSSHPHCHCTGPARFLRGPARNPLWTFGPRRQAANRRLPDPRIKLTPSGLRTSREDVGSGGVRERPEAEVEAAGVGAAEDAGGSRVSTPQLGMPWI